MPVCSATRTQQPHMGWLMELNCQPALINQIVEAKYQIVNNPLGRNDQRDSLGTCVRVSDIERWS